MLVQSQVLLGGVRVLGFQQRPHAVQVSAHIRDVLVGEVRDAAACRDPFQDHPDRVEVEEILGAEARHHRAAPWTLDDHDPRTEASRAPTAPASCSPRTWMPGSRAAAEYRAAGPEQSAPAGPHRPPARQSGADGMQSPFGSDAVSPGECRCSSSTITAGGRWFAAAPSALEAVEDTRDPICGPFAPASLLHG